MTDGSGGSSLKAYLTRVRAPGPWHAAALVVAALLGLGVAWVHWLGLFVAGGLVGLVSRTLPRAVLAGLAFGALVLVAQLLSIPGTHPGEFLALRPPVYVTVAAAFGAPAWGSLIRGVV